MLFAQNEKVTRIIAYILHVGPVHLVSSLHYCVLFIFMNSVYDDNAILLLVFVYFTNQEKINK